MKGLSQRARPGPHYLTHAAADGEQVWLFVELQMCRMLFSLDKFFIKPGIQFIP